MLKLSWAEFKLLADRFDLSVQYLDFPTVYYMVLIRPPFEVECVIRKDGTEEEEQNEFETVYKPKGNQKINIEPPFADAVGHRARYEGFPSLGENNTWTAPGVAVAGTTTALDFPIAVDRKMNGLRLVCRNHVFGDRVSFQVVGNGQVIDEFGKGWWLAEDTQLQEVSLPYAARIYAGLVLRVLYFSIGQQDVEICMNAFLHQGPMTL